MLVYRLSQHVPAQAESQTVLQWVNTVESLGTLSQQGKIVGVLCNCVWALQQGDVYVGHTLNDTTGAELASVGSADIVLVRARRGRAGAQAVHCSLNQQSPLFASQ